MRFIHPRTLPEANIQAHFYMRCVQESIPVLLEYKVRGARFDAVIHYCDQILFIIEVKNITPERVALREATGKKYKQITRYEAYGVPILLIHCMEEIEPAIRKIKEALPHSDWMAA